MCRPGRQHFIFRLRDLQILIPFGQLVLCVAMNNKKFQHKYILNVAWDILRLNKYLLFT